MSQKLVSSVFAILFLIAVQMLDGVFRYLLIGVSAYALVLMAYNAWYLRSIGQYTFWAWIRPLLSLSAVMGIFFVVPEAGFLKGLFLIFATMFLYFSELTIAASAEQVMFINTLIAFFGLSTGLLAQHFYFPSRSYLVLIALGVLSYCITRSSLDYIPQPENKKNFYSLILALCIIEVAWTLSFLPFHFTALAIFLFNAFYVLWILTYYHLFNNLSKKKVAFHVVFACALILMTIITTPWE